MPVAMTQAIEAGTEVYDAVTERLDVANDPPAGMIFHSAGVRDGSLVIFDVWESVEDFERFREERLTPAFEAVVGNERLQELGPPDRTIYELHNLVRG